MRVVREKSNTGLSTKLIVKAAKHGHVLVNGAKLMRTLPHSTICGMRNEAKRTNVNSITSEY